ncbi:ATPase, partial [Streptococcus pseudopneumoniae]
MGKKKMIFASLASAVVLGASFTSVQQLAVKAEAQPADDSAQPADDSAQPADDSAQPADDSAQPADDSAQPADDQLNQPIS